MLYDSSLNNNKNSMSQTNNTIETPKNGTLPKVNSNRRMSLANLVTSQIEKKRSLEMNTKEKQSLKHSIIKGSNFNKDCEFNSKDSHSIELNMQLDSKSSNWFKDNYRDDESYNSVFNRIGEAVSESETLFQFLKKALSIFYYSKLSTFIVGSLAIFHLSMIYTGINNLENCPKESKIPIYVFICGGIGFVKCLQVIWLQFQKNSDTDDYMFSNRSNSFGNDVSNNVSNHVVAREESQLKKGSKVTDNIVTIFLLVWFILGNHWIWSIYEPNYEMILLEPSNWCARRLYVFSIIHLIVYYSMFGLVVLLIILLTIFSQIPCLILAFQGY